MVILVSKMFYGNIPYSLMGINHTLTRLISLYVYYYYTVLLLHIFVVVVITILIIVIPVVVFVTVSAVFIVSFIDTLLW